MPASPGQVNQLGSAHDRARVLPSNRRRADELETFLANHAASDDIVTEWLALHWAGYFGNPQTAPPLPPGVRLSFAPNAESSASLHEAIADASFARALSMLAIPTAFVLGMKSPIPHGCAEATAASMLDAEVTLVADAGHLPWNEHPGCVAVSLARLRTRIS
jgi:pimeloyl-ACP methyl ester carboxylesterase